MVDLDMDALRSRGMTPTDVVTALGEQNLQAPSGDVKIGDRDYQVPLNNSTDTVAALNDLPVKTINDVTVFVRDVAHVRDGYTVQTNSVAQNGHPATLMTIRKTGGVSTLSVIDGIRDALPDIEHLLPKGMAIKPLFDQSIFVKAALNSVLMGGAMAAGLTALMILLFLGNWRLTLIILISIPLSVVTAMLVMYCLGETLNTMTLGGFALAVGILVDNGTVVIENIERHLGMGKKLEPAIIGGARRNRHADTAVHARYLHRFCSRLPVAGDREISLFAALDVGLPFVTGKPGAVIYACSSAVQIFDAIADRQAQPGEPARQIACVAV